MPAHDSSASQRVARYFDRLHTVTMALSRALTTEQVARVIAAEGAAALGADVAGVALLSADGTTLELTAGTGYPDDFLARWRRFSIDIPAPLTEAVRQRVPVWVESAGEWDTRFPTTADGQARLGFSASLCLPLLSEEEVLGGIGLSFTAPRLFSAEDRAFMQTVAEQCTQALVRARLHDQVEQELAERRRAEAALRASEELLSFALQSTGMFAYIWDIRGGVVRRLPDGGSRAGVSPDPHGVVELILAPVHSEDRERLREQLLGVLNGKPGLEAEHRVIGTNGAVSWVLTKGRTVFDDTGAPVELIGVVQDISRRRQADAALRASEERHRTLAEASAVLASSLDYEVTLASVTRMALPALADWCTVHVLEPDGQVQRSALAHVDPAGEALLHEVRRRYPFDPRGPHPVAQVMRTGVPLLVPEADDALFLTFARDDAHVQVLHQLIASYMVVPLVARGQTLGAMAFSLSQPGRRYGPDDLALAQDLARRAALAIDNARLYHEAREARQAAEVALQVRDQFLSAITHDLGQPLTVIKLGAQMLARRLAKTGTLDAAGVGEELATIDTTVMAAQALVNDLIDLARLQAGQPLDLVPRSTDLVAFVRREAAALQKTTARHHIRVEATEAEIVGEWDPPRLARVLSNLLSNAIKYSPAGGDITVTVSRDGGPEGNWALVEVRDEGIGIPAADLPYIFRRFHRGSNVVGRIAGTGIGLAGAQQIVEQHGGTLTVTSAAGKGSTFTVRLPLG